MSANNENSEGVARVTRSRLRRDSSESINLDSNLRPDTPTNRPVRATRKLEAIDEKIATPTKRTTRAGSIQRTLDEDKTTPASPLRRTTRRMSSESEINITSSPARISRRKQTTTASSAVTVPESEDDDVMFVGEHVATPRTKSRKRISAVVKLEGVVEEQQLENDDESKNDKSTEFNKSIELNKSTESNNELELRNRSVSKSPLVTKSPLAANTSQRSSLSMTEPNETSQDIIITNETSPSQDNQITCETSLSQGDLLSKNNDLIQLDTPPVGLNHNLQDSPINKMKKYFVNRISEFVGIKPTSSETFGDETLIQEVKSPNLVTNELTGSENMDSWPMPRRSLKAQNDSNNSPQRDSKDTSQKNESNITPQKSYSKITPQKSDSNNVSLGSQEEAELHENIYLSIGSQEEAEAELHENIYLSIGSQEEAEEAELLKNINKSILENNDLIEMAIQPSTPARKSLNSSMKTKTPQKSTEQVELIINNVKNSKEKSNKKRLSSHNEKENSFSIISRDSGFSKADDEETNSQANKTPSKNKSVSEMLKDFFPAPSPAKQNKSVRKTPSKGEDDQEKITKANKSQVFDVSMSCSIDEDSACDQTNQQVLDMDITKFQAKDSEKENSESNSWSQSVRQSASKKIDVLKTAEKEVIRESSQIKRRKLVSSDESESDDDEYINKLFVDEEAEEASEDEESMTLSEREYLKEHEVEERGESLGSQDSDADELHDEEVEEEEEQEDSFIDDNEICDEYSLNSEEEHIEKDEEEAVGKSTKKRKSRIIAQSSSDDESQPEKISVMNRSKESRSSKISNEDEIVSELPKPIEISKKRKRDSVGNVNTPKRLKVMSANESEAIHMEDESNLMANNTSEEKMEVDSDNENIEETEVVNPSAKKEKKVVNIEDILQRTQEYMEHFKSEKKSQLAMKKERKALKLAKKKEEQQQVENLDSSNGENKENATKKKKKNKNKKQKNVEDIDDGKKEDMSEKLDKLQAKLEAKRERKREKKLAKMAQQQTEENDGSVNVEKKQKKMQSSEDSHEKVLSAKNAKKSKQLDTEEGQAEIAVPLKKKGKKRTSDGADETIQQEEVPKVHEKKSKKRSISEVVEDNEEMIEKPKAKKQLNILKQLEEPSQRLMSNKHKAYERQEENLPTNSILASNVSSKVKKLIPKELDNVGKIKSNKRNAAKKIAEPKISLPRPVFTTAGIFIEESIKPFEFKSTEYKPVKYTSVTNKVIAFEGKRAKSQYQNVDFKMEMVNRKKNRDKSMKNLKNLI